jgi:hypothetical protein
MAAPRKKWRITTWTAGGPVGPVSCSSEKDVYRRVTAVRHDPGRVTSIVIEVSENGGRTWQTFERLNRSQGDF